MSDIETRLSDPQDTEMAEYRAVSGLAVCGLLVALLALVALIHPACWIVPPVAILLCLAALIRIANEDLALVGRKAALAAGLATMLSTLNSVVVAGG